MQRKKSAADPKPRYRKIRLIANPQSSGGAPQKQEHLVTALERHGLKPEEVVSPQSPEQTEAAARRSVSEGCDLVIGAGGDGTINLLANGLAQSDTALAAIPAGTANVFMRQYGIPDDLDRACAAIAGGSPIRVDLGTVKERYFVCTSGVGFDAHVLKQTDPRIKKISGYAAYLFGAIRSFIHYPFHRVVLEIDGEKKQYRGYTAIINNAKYYGGNFIFAPDANVTDGLLDILLFTRRDIGTVLRYLSSVTMGTISSANDVIVKKAHEVRVLTHGKHPIHIDGENIDRTPAHYRVAQKALTVIAHSV